MAKPRAPGRLRGLRDVKTWTVTDHSTSQPHKVHLKIAALEMERGRKVMEREAAAARILALDIRILEIEADVAVMLAILQAKGPAQPVRKIGRGPGRTQDPDGGSGSEGQESRSGFRIRY